MKHKKKWKYPSEVAKLFKLERRNGRNANYAVITGSGSYDTTFLHKGPAIAYAKKLVNDGGLKAVVVSRKTGQITRILSEDRSSCVLCGNELEGKKHCPLCGTLHAY